MDALHRSIATEYGYSIGIVSVLLYILIVFLG